MPDQAEIILARKEGPLTGKIVVFTRPKEYVEKFAGYLEETGCDILSFPVFRIDYVADNELIQNFAAGKTPYDWVVFTSGQAVTAVNKYPGARTKLLHSGVKIAVVGAKTREAAEEIGLTVNFEPSEFTADGLILEMPRAGSLLEQRILYPTSDLADEKLKDGLEKAGAKVVQTVAYRNQFQRPKGVDINQLLDDGRIAALTFASPSAVNYFMLIVAPEAIKNATVAPLVASIGPSTSAALEKHRLTPDVVADEHTIAGLCKNLIDKLVG